MPWGSRLASDDGEKKRVVETQVANTIAVLDQVIKDYMLEGGFLDIVKRCRESIYVRALAEENMGKHITATNVLTGGNTLQIPDYGLNPTKEAKKKKKTSE